VNREGKKARRPENKKDNKLLQTAEIGNLRVPSAQMYLLLTPPCTSPWLFVYILKIQTELR
jgi:hypothetical protein